MPSRFINIFLGVPYAKPPVYERRFKPPEDPGVGWDSGIRYWDAAYYRDACPQELWHIGDKYQYPRNTSEDCLHLNIFAPNLTDRSENKNKDYPVFVFVQGDDYKLGDSKLYPGHIVAKKEVLVVTFNYRLGALGFMSTLDSSSPGNYGLMDLIHVLKFVRNNIAEFGGDPNKVTLAGSGSGAAMVSLMLVSPHAWYNNKQLFHQAILMSGSDLCEWSTVDTVWNADAMTYSRDLGRQVGCDADYGLSNHELVECLRDRHYDEIVNASATVYKRYGSLAGPFAPVVDGDLLPKSPKVLREEGEFLKVKIMAGLTRDEGAYYAKNSTRDIIGLNIEEGLDQDTFREILYKMVQSRLEIRNVHEVVGAMEFEYTFWSKPDNKTAVRQNLIDLWSDQVYGWCLDATLKYHALCDAPNDECQPVWMYEFNHRSEYELIDQWMGVPHGKDVAYLFGTPFINETLGNITGLVPDQWDWTYLDRNISEFMQDMWANFTKYSMPTTDWTRNVTWYPFHQYNLSYLHITEFSYMDINYRQSHYAFWREYYPSISSRMPITTTPQPTPHPLVNYQIATWALVGAALITIFIIAALAITLWRKGKSSMMDDEW
ncbi:hypothetical protein CAPTEDRAFT_93848 [Capitella teleta]|uniref:Carboxylesterase type B domain-containing protein n=2 Tax=Capitella teleta TaxID=283909 RepID=R7UX79_CAPTE|nr:hypothetical protein CAPTEDRAFT_93848 [Capitella teleta]|eukprot:ELU08011.1 hypothetical protein CAPTEDRAFT_93848 [Capitella teleta]